MPPRHRPAGPIASRRIAPPKPINQAYAAPDFFGTHAPREAGREARPRPLSGFGATDLVGERPRNSGITAWPSRARVRVTTKVNAHPLSQLLRSGRGEADPVPERVAASSRCTTQPVEQPRAGTENYEKARARA